MDKLGLKCLPKKHQYKFFVGRICLINVHCVSNGWYLLKHITVEEGVKWWHVSEKKRRHSTQKTTRRVQTLEWLQGETKTINYWPKLADQLTNVNHCIDSYDVPKSAQENNHTKLNNAIKWFVFVLLRQSKCTRTHTPKWRWITYTRSRNIGKYEAENTLIQYSSNTFLFLNSYHT